MYSCHYYGYPVTWNMQQPAFPMYYYTNTSWSACPQVPVKCCCPACCPPCCCHSGCSCSCSKAAVEAAVKAVTDASAAAAASAPKSGKLQLEGKMELKSTPESSEKSRRGDEEETPRSWRRVSSLPKLRAERPSRDYSDDSYYSPRSRRNCRDRYSRSDGRCEGTFVIKGMPKSERREPRRRESSRIGNQDCSVKGTLIFNAD